MESVLAQFVMQWGPLGVIVLFAMYIIYDKLKHDAEKTKNKSSKYTDNGTFALVLDKLTELGAELKSIDERFDLKLQKLEDKLNSKVEDIQAKITAAPDQLIGSLEQHHNAMVSQHNQRFMNQIKLGPMLHRTMGNYMSRINCEHIVLGSLHNGTSSLSGIPFCKFDIISEKFNPTESPHDIEFAPMYRNVDLMIHGKLPSLLIQTGHVHFVIDEDGNSELENIDDILYRRMVGDNIKQIAINTIVDSNYLPIGFLACIRYDYEDMDLVEINNCTNEIEKIYNKGYVS